jgi:hypothetical protein
VLRLPPADAKQQRLGAKEEFQEKEIFVPPRRKKTRRKPACEVVIRNISTRTSSGPMLIAQSS